MSLLEWLILGLLGVETVLLLILARYVLELAELVRFVLVGSEEKLVDLQHDEGRQQGGDHRQSVDHPLEVDGDRGEVADE